MCRILILKAVLEFIVIMDQRNYAIDTLEVQSQLQQYILGFKLGVFEARETAYDKLCVLYL